MGMYTEVFCRTDLARNTPEEVKTLLDLWVTKGEYETLDKMELPDHPFFKCYRWYSVAHGLSAYAPYSESRFGPDPSYPGKDSLVLHASLKNYDDEISKFFDWINQYSDECEGRFIGYSLYEEDDTPILFHKETK